MSEQHNITYGKNLIINGSFLISQRDTSFAAVASGSYTLDRWAYSEAGAAVVTITQETADVPTFDQSGVSQTACAALKVDVTTADAAVAAGDFAVITHNIEGYRYSALRGKYGTLSFWVKSPKTGTHCVAFRNSGVDRSYIAEYTVNSADTWEKKSVTVLFDNDGGTWDYTNGVGLRVVWTLYSGTTKQTTAGAWQSGNYVATSNQVNCVDDTANNFLISQAQLEVGQRATNFETRDFAVELALCQRYTIVHGPGAGWGGFEDDNSIINCAVITTTTSRGVYFFPVAMRANPTFSVSNVAHFYIVAAGSNETVSVLAQGDGGNLTARLAITHSNNTAGNAGYLRYQNASGWIMFDAEL